MGVDDAKRRLLLLQVSQDAHQDDVLDDVGEAAGMEGVTVVHGGGVTTSGVESNLESFRAMRSIEISRFPDARLRI